VGGGKPDVTDLLNIVNKIPPYIFACRGRGGMLELVPRGEKPSHKESQNKTFKILIFQRINSTYGITNPEISFYREG